MSQELNPYQAPQSSAAPTPLPRNRRAGCIRGSLGCGCLTPLLLFLLAALSGDTGAPLFWPILAIVCAVIGAALGYLFAPQREIKK